MAEYIDREEVLKYTTLLLDTQNYCVSFAVTTERIREIPAADVAPVVHAAWIFFCGVGEHFPRCSQCGEEADEEIARPYCAYCGARMDMPHEFDYSDDRKRKDGGRK